MGLTSILQIIFVTGLMFGPFSEGQTYSSGDSSSGSAIGPRDHRHTPEHELQSSNYESDPATSKEDDSDETQDQSSKEEDLKQQDKDKKENGNGNRNRKFNREVPEPSYPDEKKGCPESTPSPCADPQTGSVPLGVAAGLVVAGVVLGVLLTLACGLLCTGLRKKTHSRYLGKTHGETSSPTALENPLASHVAVQGQYSAAAASRDSHLYSELSVYNEPCSSRGQSRDEYKGYDHIGHLTPHPILDPTYNRAYTPLTDQGRQPAKYYKLEENIDTGVGGTAGNGGLYDRNKSPDTDDNGVAEDIATQHNYFVLEKVGNDAGNAMVNATKRGDRMEKEEEDGSVAQHDYFVLESQTKMASKDAKDAMVNNTTRGGPLEESEEDEVAARHDYFVLEPHSKKTSKEEGVTKDNNIKRGDKMKE